MATTPIIRSSGSVSGVVTGEGRNDLDIAETVTLSDSVVGNTGASYAWVLIDKPPGSVAVLNNPNTATPNFVPDVTGSYRFRCTADGVPSHSAVDTQRGIVLSVPLPNSGARMPSRRERLDYNAAGNTSGWHPDLIAFMRWTDANIGGAAYNLVHSPPGTPITQRTTLAFTSAFSVTDVSSRTQVDLATGGVALTKVATQAALSVVANATNSTASPTAVASSAAGEVFLRTASNTLAWSTLLSTSFADNTIAPSRLANVAARAVLANASNGTGPVTAVAASSASNFVLKENGAGFLTWDLLGNANIAAAAGISISKLANIAAFSVVGNGSNGAAAPTAVAAANDGEVLRRSGATLAFGTLVSGSFADNTIVGSRLSGFTNTAVAIGTSGGGLQSLANGTNGHVLTMVSGAPAWAAAAGGGAPADAEYVVAVANGTLSAERVATATSTIGVDAGTGGQFKWNVIQSALDHGSIGGLGDDDHTQYALLAGRSGGQVLTGGTAAGNDIQLLSTSNGTKGQIYLGSNTVGVEIDEANAGDGGAPNVEIGGATADGTSAAWSIKFGTNRYGCVYQSDRNSNNNPVFHRFRAADELLGAIGGNLNTLQIAGQSGRRVRFTADDSAITGPGLDIDVSYNYAFCNTNRTTGSYGSGSGVVFFANRVTAPSGTPSTGFLEYGDGGRPTFKDSFGVVTVL
jgi:hypothetical protein